MMVEQLICKCLVDPKPAPALLGCAPRPRHSLWRGTVHSSVHVRAAAPDREHQHVAARVQPEARVQVGFDGG